MATARRHSLLSLPRLLVNYNKLLVPRSGTYIMKPTASCEAAQLWVRTILPPHIVLRRGTDRLSAMGGCVATARRHSLLSLPRLL